MTRFTSKLLLLLLLSAAAILCPPLRVHGQDNPIINWLHDLQPPDPNEPRAYVELPVSPGLAVEFQMRLMQGQQQDRLRRTLAEIVEAPDKFGFDPEMLKQVDFDNPMTKLVLHQWMVGSGGRINDRTLRQLQFMLRDNLEFQKRRGKMPLFPVGKLPILPPLMPPAAAGPQVPVEEDGLSKLMHKFMREADASGLGDYLKQSPSWHEGLAKLRDGQTLPGPLEGWNQTIKDWGLADRIKLTWGDKTLERLGKLSLPDLPRLSLNVGNLSLSRPDLHLPNFSAGPGISGGETVLLVVLITGLVIAAWRFFKVKRPTQVQIRAALLGPWPVAPSQVGTRADLIAAFEYLAYLRLGPEVKTWNHRLIAAALAPSTSPLAEAADQLSRLYEQARYTPGEETLEPTDKDQAQRSLALLAAS